jgi:hypothetical protein
VHDLAQGLSDEAAVNRPPLLPALDKAGPAQHLQMLHHGRQRDPEGLGQGADRRVRLCREASEQRAARRVGQRVKRAIELGGFILYHAVK